MVEVGEMVEDTEKKVEEAGEAEKKAALTKLACWVKEREEAGSTWDGAVWDKYVTTS